MPENQFDLWVFGDVHVGTDKKFGRESLAETLRQSESGDFDWDLALDIGDMSGGQSVPEDDEGEEIVRQFGALEKHPREAIYTICGNHDRSGLREEQNWWWRKWLDPTGEHTEHSKVDASARPYPVEGTWERYSFRAGNLLFLCMSDINEPTQTIGRGDLGGKVGGNPSGVVSGETFAWWRRMVEENPDCIIISGHHYMLKETTVASGEWEGMDKQPDGSWKGAYHGYKPECTPMGASYLYFVDSVPDAQAFENYLAEHNGATDIWVGGHTHAHPDADRGGRTHVETKWGTHFINCGAITRYHINPEYPNPPKSRLFTFTEGSDEVLVRCYMHTAEFLPQGWYAPAQRTLKLSKPFRSPADG